MLTLIDLLPAMGIDLWLRLRREHCSLTFHLVSLASALLVYHYTAAGLVVRITDSGIFARLESCTY